MTKRLNLTIVEELVEAIKKFAKKNRSVSKIVSEQIKTILTNPGSKTIPFSQRAAGIIKGKKFNDLEKLRGQYLKEKYGI